MKSYLDELDYFRKKAGLDNVDYSDVKSPSEEMRKLLKDFRKSKSIKYKKKKPRK